MNVSLTDLVLRRPAARDAAQVLAIALDPDVALWNPMPKVAHLASARDWCVESANWSTGAHATWLAVDARNDLVVATCSLFDISTEESTGSIGYRVAASARGQGVARIALDAVTRWAFDELELVRVQLAHSVGNEASCRVALAAGFALEGTLRSSHVDGHHIRRDEHIHGRLADDQVPGLGVTPVMQF